MSSSPTPPSTTKAWVKLHSLAKKPPSIKDELARDKDRAESNRLSAAGITLDYAKNIVNAPIMSALHALAEEMRLSEQITGLFDGDAVNTTESRPALHTALRATKTGIALDGLNIDDAIAATRKRCYALADALRKGTYKGYSGKPIVSVVNIGIGGSDMGVKTAYNALRAHTADNLGIYFVASVDSACMRDTLKELNPETTLFVVQSKSFNTKETLMNAQRARAWLEHRAGNNEQQWRHFVAVTANRERAAQFGIAEEQILPIWDWVGGRYSLWSAAGLTLMIAIGGQRFDELLAGARAMDEHFRNSDASANMPIVLALLGIWYHNFLGAKTHALIPYCFDLRHLPDYVQQLDMESNGKRTSRSGEPLDYDTAPIVWGQVGSEAQHAFFQLLHQGSHLVSLDLLAPAQDAGNSSREERALLANMVAQSYALMNGREGADVPPHKRHAGNKPSNIIVLDELNPFCFGALIALYEHKVFVQGAIWGLNSFDQWGVEWSKALASSLDGGEKQVIDWDSASQHWIKRFGLD